MARRKTNKSKQKADPKPIAKPRAKPRAKATVKQEVMVTPEVTTTDEVETIIMPQKESINKRLQDDLTRSLAENDRLKQQISANTAEATLLHDKNRELVGILEKDNSNMSRKDLESLLKPAIKTNEGKNILVEVVRGTMAYNEHVYIKGQRFMFPAKRVARENQVKALEY